MVLLDGLISLRCPVPARLPSNEFGSYDAARSAIRLFKYLSIQICQYKALTAGGSPLIPRLVAEC